MTKHRTNGFNLIELMSLGFLHSHPRKKRKFGFTLIELMIVIAIIAILASILVPNFAKSKEKAQLETCKQNLHNLGIAAEMYADENNGKYTPTVTWYYPDYLVTAGFLKVVPKCPLGNSYYIHGKYPTACRDHFPGGYALALCLTYTGGAGIGIRHNGLGDNCPYWWPGGGVWEK